MFVDDDQQLPVFVEAVVFGAVQRENFAAAAAVDDIVVVDVEVADERMPVVAVDTVGVGDGTPRNVLLDLVVYDLFVQEVFVAVAVSNQTVV
mgnify:CR=1 FL=1